MDVSTTLLVILMFTSIIGIGIGHILVTLSSFVSQLGDFRGRRMGITWLLILLITFLAMFWNGTVLARREAWSFALFLFAISGPIVLLFASSLISTLLQQSIASESRTEPVESPLLARFFLLFAMAQAWAVGMDFVLGNGWITATWGSAILCGIAIALIFIKNGQVRIAFTAAMLLATLADIVLNNA